MTRKLTLGGIALLSAWTACSSSRAPQTMPVTEGNGSQAPSDPMNDPPGTSRTDGGMPQDPGGGTAPVDMTSSNADGGATDCGPTRIIDQGTPHPILLRTTDEKMIYWIDHDVNVGAYAAAKDGTGAITRLAPVTSRYVGGAGWDLAVDDTYAYVLDRTTQSIVRVSKADGSQLQLVKSPNEQCGAWYPGQVVAFAGDVYYSEGFAAVSNCNPPPTTMNRIRRISSTGGNPVDIAVGSVGSLAVDSSGVYFVNDTNLMRMTASGPTVLASGLPAHTTALSSNGKLVVGGASDGSLFAVSTAGGVIETFTSPRSIPILEVSALGDSFYFSDGTTTFRANTDGTAVTAMAGSATFAIDSNWLFTNGIDRRCR